MQIEGIGTVSKEEVINTISGIDRAAALRGEIPEEELAARYKEAMVKEIANIGDHADMFTASYNWIPNNLKESLPSEDLAHLVDQFFECYEAGRRNMRDVLQSEAKNVNMT